MRHSLVDFWRWSVSDLLSNATRGVFAEFLVGTALDAEQESSKEERDAYDLITRDGIKVEVKSSAYIQTRKQKKHSAPSFSIKPARAWEEDTTNGRGKARRHADVYVCCLLHHIDQTTVDPLETSQWTFYVVPTSTLDRERANQGMIGLNSLKKIAQQTTYTNLATEV